jgi:hypothetical protein
MKPRLFCFGDSFVEWDIPKYHWTYYLSHHYEVYKFGRRGADNNSIIFQLGNLPKMVIGDRVLIMFTEPGRLPHRYYGERKERFKFNKYLNLNFFKDSKFAQKLVSLNYDESERWLNGKRDIEIEFLKKLKIWLNNYNPVFVTWNENFHKPTSDFVSLIQVTSSWEEGTGEKEDFHPGPKGCYDMYKKIHTLLDVSEPFVNFEIEDKDLI